jgi:uncharacterized protein
MNMKAVFHVDELEKWDLLITNVENLVKGINVENSKIAIVANSRAVLRYKNDSGLNNASLEELSRKGVIIMACNNALNSLQIGKEMLYAFVKVVPIGVKEIIERQLEGYAYIKP